MTTATRSQKSLLSDNNPKTNSDNIYIDSKFSLFTEQDYDENEFTPEQLYVFEPAKDDSEKLIYPFINSSLC